MFLVANSSDSTNQLASRGFLHGSHQLRNCFFVSRQRGQTINLCCGDKLTVKSASLDFELLVRFGKLFEQTSGSADMGPRGEPLVDDDFLLLFNAHHEDMDFSLPADGAPWCLRVDTASATLPDDEAPPLTQPALRVHCRSLVLLARPTRPQP